MPNIKPEQASRLSRFLSTSRGELITVCLLGSIAFSSAVSLTGFILSFVSQTLYPFSYSFLSAPLHTYLPRITVSPSLPASLIFGALMTVAVYYFEKNIFYRRFHLLLKAAFASVAATALVFVSNLLAYAAGSLSILLYRVDASELPLLILYFYLMSIAIFKLCDAIRRQIFLLP